MKASLVFAVVVVALTGLLASHLKSGPSPIEDAAPQPETRVAELAVVVPSYESNVVLPRAADGHFYADVTVNGFSSRMLVDTGASVLALTGADAEAAGIHWLPDDIRPVARGASGAVLGVAVRLEQVQVGDIELRGVAAIVVPEGLGLSLLGQSFLSEVQRVEIDAERMVLGNRGS